MAPVRGPSSGLSKTLATAVVVAGVGVVMYIGYNNYYKKNKKCCDKGKKVPAPAPSPKSEPEEKEQKNQPSPVPEYTPAVVQPFQPEPKPKDDFPSKTSESFVVIPPKSMEDSVADVSASSIKTSDDENNFIKLSLPRVDNISSDNSPVKMVEEPKRDISEMPEPIQKLDQLADLVEEKFDQAVRNMTEEVEEFKERVVEDSHHESHE